MECPKCQGSWFAPKGSTLLTCPFCQYNMQSISGETEESVDILRRIVLEFGPELYLNAIRFQGVLREYFRFDASLLMFLTLLVEHQGARTLYQHYFKEGGEFERERRKLILQLSEETFIPVAKLEEGVNLLCQGLGKKVSVTFAPKSAVITTLEDSPVELAPILQLPLSVFTEEKLEKSEKKKDYASILEDLKEELQEEMAYPRKNSGILTQLPDMTDWSSEAQRFLQLAVRGDSQAQYDLACCYGEGKGLPTDLEQSFFWLLQSGTQENHLAQFALSTCYKDGIGTEIDLKQAFYWAERSANQENPEAQLYLSECYDNGVGNQVDTKKSLYWLEKSAKLGNAQAQFSLALRYSEGVGVTQDLEKAFHWNLASSNQGNSAAQSLVGLSYEFGDGVEKDVKQAFLWYQKSAKQKNPLGAYHLAVCYEHGIAIDVDKVLAFEWMEQSAMLGYSEAQYSLWRYYSLGIGVEDAEGLAEHWLEKSAQQGHKEALERLKKTYL